MDKKQIIIEYVKNNPKPIQDLCPTCYQYWHNAAGDCIVWDSITGVRSTRTSTPRCGWRNDEFTATPRKGGYDGAYVRYVPELGLMEVASILLPVKGRGDGKVEWEFVSRYFTFKGEKEGYNEYGNNDGGSRFYSREMKQFIHDLSYTNYHYKPSSLKATIKQMGGSLKDDDYISMWRLEDWYTRNWTTRVISKKAKDLDAYNNNLPWDNSIFSDVPADTHTLVQHTILDENYTVLRRYQQDHSYSLGFGSWGEKARLFIDSKGTPTLMKKDYGSDEFKIKSDHIDKWYSSNADKTMLIGDPLENWTPLKYIKDIVYWDSRKCLDQLTNILRHPIVEQLAKSGYPTLAKEICYDDTIAANLKSYFYATEKKKPIYELLKVNKFMLKNAETLASIHAGQHPESYTGKFGMQLVRDMKRLYGESSENADIRHLSKETIDLACLSLKDMSYGDLSALCSADDYYSLRYNRVWVEVDNHTRRFVEKLFRINKKNSTGTDAIRIFLDTKKMFYRIHTDRRPDIDIRDFDDMHRLEIIHNGLVQIYNLQEEEERARWDRIRKASNEELRKQFEKRQEERIKLYEEDGDKYCIRVPKRPEDITQEGVALSHCVGGYVKEHCMGDTDIIFLRAKEYDTVPFYTIEVNHGKVIQIHGSHNRWLGNNPDAIPFVYQWIKKRNLDCDTSILLNLGAGYSRSVDSLDESYLTKVVDIEG